MHDMPQNSLKGQCGSQKEKSQGRFPNFVNPTNTAMHGSFNFKDYIRDGCDKTIEGF